MESKDNYWSTENKKIGVITLITWNLFDIVKAVGGKLINPPTEDIEITGVYHDSRELTKGAIFVPIIAERDGHDFIQDAIDKGASASFWSADLNKAPKNLPLIQVEDTEEAFKAFGQWYLEQVHPKVVGITGSNGKTTTKDMTAAVLSQKYETHKTAGNENNQLGVPKTILSMPKTTEMLVLEMGMSSPGEITIHSQTAHPDAVAVTMIGESHLQAFDGSREKLTDEKMSILDGLKEGGLFLHPYHEKLIDERLDDTIRDQTFGFDEKADIYASNIVEKTEATSFSVTLTVEDEKKELEITIPVPGKYNVNNALMAILFGLEFEVSLEEIKEGLEHFELTKNRLEWIDGVNEIHLLNDAYNASPTSVKAALSYFSGIDTQGERIVVLGDVLELGEQSKELHESMAEAVDLEKYKAVLLYGEEMEALYHVLNTREKSEQVAHFSGDKEPLIKEIKKLAKPGDIVLFKSSNGTDLLSVVDQLRVKK